ncbi:SGNH/GDSL hydrolase family protein [Flexivirga meconopsidis]|uniref:SGNH/GDSL hydrolase family protein n=1 Tax=Flexivirga meconopsidis TaxID=2977121 RepID=UPI00223FCAEF|nr:SGNH/GDSL hydrolase family protein [Flexivirga meconopsidis]
MAAAPYVALGDSYAAGVGSGDSQTSCWQTASAYPVQVAAGLGVQVDLQACIGATVGDVSGTQLAAVSRAASYVSVTVGGNDVGFTHVLTECAKPAWMGDSGPVIDAALAILREQLPTRLSTLYDAIRARAPKARVVVAGYPRLFNGVDCSLVTFFTAQEMTRLNDAADELAQVIGAAAGAAGFEFVDVRDAFAGHAVCDEEAWVHDVVLPIQESFHPTTDGHGAYASEVGRVLGVEKSVLGRPGLDLWRSNVSQGAERPTPAPVFVPPDLTSDASRVGAERHGLDPDEIAALGAERDDPAAHARLRELDQRLRERR